LVCITFAACASSPAAPRDVEATLRAHTQAMLDAIARGDAPVWDRYLDPRIVYVSEDGTVETRASLLEQLKPLPEGISGKIDIGRFDLAMHGDVAVLTYRIDEHENFFGHPIESQYLTTATWRHGGAGWKLIATQVIALQQDPPALALPPEQLEEYAGTYRLTDTVAYTIRRDGAELVGERTGGKPQPLRVEARDVMFVPGRPRSRKVFQRDARGAITGFVDRREGRDVPWVKR
jgi:uncharacterized protein DUF4440